MKKVFVLAITLVLAFSLNAQKIGVKAGYTMSGYTLNFDKPDGAKMGNGFHAGLVGQMDLKVLKLRADITYNQLGSVLETDMYTSTTDVSYLQVGVSAKKGLGPVYAFAGPYFGYALSGNNAVDAAGTVTDTDIFSANNAYEDADFNNKIDFGVYGGLGFSVAGVFAEVSVGYGFSNFLNEDSDTYELIGLAGGLINELGLNATDAGFPFPDGATAVTEPAQKNLFIGISVGYLLGF